MSFEKKMNLSESRRIRFDEIMVQWQAEVNYDHRIVNQYTSKPEQVHYHVGKTYARFDIGGSGAFMVEIETGNVYGIKGYGKADKKKYSGNVYNPGFKGAILLRDRFRYGHFTNEPDGLGMLRDEPDGVRHEGLRAGLHGTTEI
jgi:hypothetical protein